MRPSAIGYKHDASDLTKLNKYRRPTRPCSRSLNEIKLDNKKNFANLPLQEHRPGHRPQLHL